MSDPTQEPTLAQMTEPERKQWLDANGHRAYAERLAREMKGARPEPSPFAGMGPRAAAEHINAQRFAGVDLVSMSEPDRAAWIREHGLRAYDTVLRQQLRGVSLDTLRRR